MRVLKNQNRKQTDKPALKIPQKTGDESPGEVLTTPGSFDPEEFDIDFMDMIQYTPFFPAELYPYSQMQGQYPTMPYGAAAGDMYDDNGQSGFHSPGSTQDEDNEIADSAASMARDGGAIEYELTEEEMTELAKPLKKYSMNVKVKPPEVLPLLQDHGLLLSNSDDETRLSYGELFESVKSEKKSEETGQSLPLAQNSTSVHHGGAAVTASHQPERHDNLSEEQQTVLFMHDYASPVVSAVEVDSSSLNNVTSPKDTNIQQPIATEVALGDGPQLNPSTSYTVPPGSIVLTDGTVLIPTINTTNTSGTLNSVSPGKVVPPGQSTNQSLNLSGEKSSSSTVLSAQGGKGLVLPQSDLPPKFRLKKGLKNQQVPVIISALDSSPESRLVPLQDGVSPSKKMKVELLDSHSTSEMRSDFGGPSTPTSTYSLAHSISDSESSLASSTYQGVVSYEDNIIAVPSLAKNSVTMTAGNKGVKRSKTPKTTAMKLPVAMETNAAGGERLRGPKVTPVSAITDIVGLSSAKDNDSGHNSVLKEATLKPIRHRTDINGVVESAKERSVKNAINARVNRQKHKVYVQQIEEENSLLKEETVALKHQNGILLQEKDILNKEIVYLKKVIANESSLASVLSGLSGLKDVTLTSNFAKSFAKLQQAQGVVRKKSADSSSDNRRVASTSEGSESNRLAVGNSSSGSDVPGGGVCVHVSGDTASLELCEKCAEMASR